MKWPDSSKITLILERTTGLSRSLSVAIRRPNSTSSSFCNAIPDCCMSVIVPSDSSYERYNLPDAKSKNSDLTIGK